jgi:hypothetical protein
VGEPEQYDSIIHAAVRRALQRGDRELAALLLDATVASTDDLGTDGMDAVVAVDLATTPEALDLLKRYARPDEARGQSALAELLNEVWPAGYWVGRVDVRVRLEETAPDWREQLRGLVEGGPSNQGRPFGTSPVLTHGGLNYRSRAEVAIAQVLEQSEDILFLPNSAAAAGKVQREPDFLIFYKGRAGVLEVDGPTHAGRLADDTLRDSYFQRQGLFVKHYPAERCQSEPQLVVREFLGLLLRAKS